MSLPCLLTLHLLSLFFYAFPSTSQGVVPPSETFHFVNEGEIGQYIVEYDGDYRPLRIGTSPFQMCFYNTTPGAYTLALRIGTSRASSRYQWVWEANRGNPVGENASFSLGSDGNLILAHADGRVAWQSNTANKGVVGFMVLPNGNMVLHDSKDKYIWQSFDSPTDTLLVGQSLRVKGRNKLVSRLSPKENRDGPYSLVLQPDGLALYYAGKNSPKPLLYYKLAIRVDVLTFNSLAPTEPGERYELLLEAPNDRVLLTRPNYNSTFTYLRLGIDGSLNAITFNNKADDQAFDTTFSLFERSFGQECRLPERCGQFGLCEDSQCVACPSPNGLLGWSRNCAPPKLTSCKASDITYYKLAGVNHFISRYTRGSGPVKEDDCQRKCTSDCKCAGFFFHQAESRCWIVYDLMTLAKVDNSTHLGYIKTPKI